MEGPEHLQRWVSGAPVGWFSLRNVLPVQGQRFFVCFLQEKSRVSQCILSRQVRVYVEGTRGEARHPPQPPQQFTSESEKCTGKHSVEGCFGAASSWSLSLQRGAACRVERCSPRKAKGPFSREGAQHTRGHCVHPNSSLILLALQTALVTRLHTSAEGSLGSQAGTQNAPQIPWNWRQCQ